MPSGTLAGHLLPGSLFICLAIWWSFVTSIRFAQSKIKSSSRDDENFLTPTATGYKSSVWMPCVCLPCARLRRAPIESYVKIFFCLIGIMGELHYIQFNKNNNWPRMLPNGQQHTTMYTVFILNSIVEIIIYHRIDVAQRLDFASFCFSFGVEAFLFANHTHGRDLLDIHIHNLLLYAIIGCVIFSGLETYNPYEILFTYGRIFFTILQGTWFWQIGFILYWPVESEYFKWDLNDYGLVSRINVIFVWHVILILIGLIIQMISIKFIFDKLKRFQNKFDKLNEFHNGENGNIFI